MNKVGSQPRDAAGDAQYASPGTGRGESAILQPARAIRWAWVPAPLFILLIAGLWISGRGTEASYESTPLFLALTLVFGLLISLLLAVRLGRSILTHRAPELLWIALGAAFWGAAGFGGAVAGALSKGPGYANAVATVYNVAIWLSAICSLIGATLPARARAPLRYPARWLAGAYSLAILAMVGLVWATLRGLLPPLFVAGLGGTLTRELVLYSAIAMLIVTGMLFTREAPRRGNAFPYLYGHALLLLAVGVVGLLVGGPGSLSAWAGRSAHALGSLYMFVGVWQARGLQRSQGVLAGRPSDDGLLGNAVAVAVVVSAAATRVLLFPTMGDHFLFTIFYPALAFAALYAGLRAGLLATALAALIAVYFWMEPAGKFFPMRTSDLMGVLVFLISGAIISWMGDRMRAAESLARRAEAAAATQLERLDDLVRERTASLEREIAERVRTEEALRAKQAELSEAQRLAGLGSWYWDAGTDGVSASDGLLALYGLDHIPSPAEQEGTLYPPESWQRLEAAYKAAYENGTGYDLVLQARRSDGALLWIDARAEAVRDAEQHVIGLRGTVQDITKRKQAEEALRQSELRLQTLTEHAPAAIAVFDRQMRYLAASRRWMDEYRVGDPDIIGKSHYEIFPELPAAWREAHRRGLAGEVLRAEADRFERAEGAVQWIRWEIWPWRDGSDAVGGIVIAAEDITERLEAQERLRASEEVLRATFDQAAVGICHVSPQGYFLKANRRLCDMVGYSEDELRRMRFVDIAYPPDRDIGVAAFRRSIAGEIPTFTVEKRYQRRDGPILWVRVTAASVRAGGTGDVSFNVVIIEDVTERKRTEQALRESQSRLSLALKAGRSAVWDMDVSSQAVHPNEDLLFTMLGYSPGELITASQWTSLIHPEDRQGIAEMIEEVIEGESEGYWRELRLRVKDGGWRWILSQGIAAERDASGRATRLVGTHSDITERKQAEERAREAALHDPLTGLPNRALVFEYGNHLLAAAYRRHTQGALLFIDLDRFKPINDLYGHEIGDRVLQEIARRLVGCTRHEDLVGRLGGDEFVIVLPHIQADRHRAAVVAMHVVESISEPIRVDSLELALSPSIGISYYPEHAGDMSALIHAADLAMYQAKQSGRANYQFYTPELDRQADEAYSLEARLKNALKHGDLKLYYQPVVDIHSGRLIGAEALVRLADLGQQPVGPASFIPVAEATGLIGDLGEWVATEACRQHGAWLGEGLRVCIAINVSPLQFRQRDFAERLGNILSDSGVDPTCLQLEVTESAVMESVDEAVEILNRLKSLGVKVALDDFGTGYSSLSSLSSLPLDKLKVDQSFVRRIASDQASRAVTEAIIGLGRSLKLEVVGEGIESEDALSYLQAHGCDQAQGFWFSQPLPAEEFAEWCREHPVH